MLLATTTTTTTTATTTTSLLGRCRLAVVALPCLVLLLQELRASAEQGHRR
jgi:hypothetical protein